MGDAREEEDRDDVSSSDGEASGVEECTRQAPSSTVGLIEAQGRSQVHMHCLVWLSCADEDE